MCAMDRHDMTLAVKVELNPNATNQPLFIWIYLLMSARANVIKVYMFITYENLQNTLSLFS